MTPAIPHRLDELARRRRFPVATYRLQLHKGFTFHHARLLVPYLDALGITDLYVSPILRSEPGSRHGYDICDHHELDPDLGTREDFDALCESLKSRAMGLIMDFVPNHMGNDPAFNPWWKDVLLNGPDSEYASYFDIDWHPAKPELQGKVLLPILGDLYGAVLERGELTLVLDNGQLALRYFQKTIPVNPRSLLSSGERLTAERVQRLNGTPGDRGSFDALHALLEAQSYRLAYWKTAFHEINYRRFFDVNELVGLRMENPAVFEHAHALTLQLLSEGKITGLRLDHPDGLRDPAGYFEALQDAFLNAWVRQELSLSGEDPEAIRSAIQSWRRDHRKADLSGVAACPLFVVAEKILSPGESLPSHWAVHGTTGYDFLNQVNGLFVDPAAAHSLRRIFMDFTQDYTVYDRVRVDAKRLIMSTSLAGELNVLSDALNRISEKDRRTRDFTRETLRQGLREVISCFPVYRTYINAYRGTAWDRDMIQTAVKDAKRRNPTLDPALFDFIQTVLLPENADKIPTEEYQQQLDFAMKFQQYTAPVQAKSVEDTAFYRYLPLLSLNEVGGDPDTFGCPVEEFHRQNAARLRDWPCTMLATSTHDTKRGEDARLRLNVLSEMPGEWEKQIREWSSMNAPSGISREDEYLFYQTILSIWPADGEVTTDWISRIQAYLRKAIREAKRYSSWLHPVEAYEKSVETFIDRVLTFKTFLRSVDSFAQGIHSVSHVYSLGQVVLKIASPGVPDFYQGTESWDLTLVDPDNRRVIPYQQRQQWLAELSANAQPSSEQEKLAVTRAALHFRRRCPDLFRQGHYEPIQASGETAEHIVAFARVGAGQSALVVAPRWIAHHPPQGWDDVRIPIPGSVSAPRFRDVLTGLVFEPVVENGRRQLPIKALFKRMPVSLLEGVSA